ncbi:hypothetical protein ACA910_012945 [Epithemia clementina (nom. ined.)]
MTKDDYGDDAFFAEEPCTVDRALKERDALDDAESTVTDEEDNEDKLSKESEGKDEESTNNPLEITGDSNKLLDDSGELKDANEPSDEPVAELGNANGA